MGGCSLIFLLILAIPIMIIGSIAFFILGITILAMAIGGVAAILVAVIVKIVCANREKNGIEVKSYVKIISTIILIVGIALVLPMVFGRILLYMHDLGVKKEKMKVESLYNKVIVNDHDE